MKKFTLKNLTIGSLFIKPTMGSEVEFLKIKKDESIIVTAEQMQIYHHAITSLEKSECLSIKEGITEEVKEVKEAKKVKEPKKVKEVEEVSNLVEEPKKETKLSLEDIAEKKAIIAEKTLAWENTKGREEKLKIKKEILELKKEINSLK